MSFFIFETSRDDDNISDSSILGELAHRLAVTSDESRHSVVYYDNNRIGRKNNGKRREFMIMSNHVIIYEYFDSIFTYKLCVPI